MSGSVSRSYQSRGSTFGSQGSVIAAFPLPYTGIDLVEAGKTKCTISDSGHVMCYSGNTCHCQNRRNRQSQRGRLFGAVNLLNISKMGRSGTAADLTILNFLLIG